VAAVVQRFPLTGDHAAASVVLPPGQWTGVLDGDSHEGEVSLADLCGALGSAVLERA
jgi:hypothetical protein